MARTDGSLQAEYLMLQGQYEAFDQRALSLKALAAPLLGAGFAVGLGEGRWPALLATFLAATMLWILEGMWKSFQYCLAPRILILEAWFRGDGEEAIAPFQVYTAWHRAWSDGQRRAASIVRVMREPFVCLPYAPIAVASASALALGLLR